jgi:hypothetical protein
MLDNNMQFLNMLEGNKDIFSFLAGMKRQAMDVGFSEEIAEKLVLAMVVGSNKS